MESIIKKFQKINMKTIKTLSVIALICATLNAFSYFLTYEYLDYSFPYPNTQLVFYFPGIILLLSMLFMIAPFILLVVYIFKFHGQNKASAIVPAIFGIIAFNQFYSLGFSVFGYYYQYITNIVLSLAITITFGLATYGALKGLSNKLFVLIATGVGMLASLTDFINFLSSLSFYIEASLDLFIFIDIIYIISTVLLYISLLFFGMKYEIPCLVGGASTKKIDPQIDYAEQELKILTEKFELGLISAEEYQARRMEIINKL